MNNTAENADLLIEQARTALSARLERSVDYNQAEIEKVSRLSHRLVPKGISVDEHTSERLRALARLSQTELQPPISLKSHRKIIGPVIVAAKRAIWPLLGALLKNFVEAQREYNSLLLEEYLCHLNSCRRQA
ncbi:MAG: hypothetical protein KDD66_16730 [Bdellovibrionales bacterium]|nr:hypothetical protein [Bdellovibrionales bacterium]